MQEPGGDGTRTTSCLVGRRGQDRQRYCLDAWMEQLFIENAKELSSWTCARAPAHWKQDWIPFLRSQVRAVLLHQFGPGSNKHTAKQSPVPCTSRPRFLYIQQTNHALREYATNYISQWAKHTNNKMLSLSSITSREGKHSSCVSFAEYWAEKEQTSTNQGQCFQFRPFIWSMGLKLCHSWNSWLWHTLPRILLLMFCGLKLEKPKISWSNQTIFSMSFVDRLRYMNLLPSWGPKKDDVEIGRKNPFLFWLPDTD